LAGILTLAVPVLGVAAWIMMVPLETTFVWEVGMSPFLPLTPVVLGGIVGRALVIGEMPLSALGAVFILVFLVLEVLVNVLKGYGEGLRPFVSLFLLLAMAGLISTEVERSITNFWVLSHALVWSAIAVLAISILSLDVESAWRLAVGGQQGADVRNLANRLGIAFMLVVGGLVYEYRGAGKSFFPFQNRPLAQVSFLLLFGAGVAATVSRGVILAILVGLLVMVISNLFVRRSPLVLNGKRAFISIMLIGMIGAISVLYIDIYIAQGHLTRRVMEAVSDPGESNRIRIWNNVLRQLNGSEWIIGATRGFKTLSTQNFYAHSVFFDALVTMGLLGLGGLLAFFVYVGIKLVASHNTYGIGLLFFLGVSFATYGSLASKQFWLLLGVVLGLARIGVPCRKKQPADVQSPV